MQDTESEFLLYSPLNQGLKPGRKKETATVKKGFYSTVH